MFRHLCHSSVSVVSTLEAARSRDKLFLCDKTPGPLQGAHPLDTGSSFSRVKLTGREADHSPHLLPRLRMTGAKPPLPNVPLWIVQLQLNCVA